MSRLQSTMGGAWKAYPFWVVMAVGLAALGAILFTQVGDRSTGIPSEPSTFDGDVILTGFRFSTIVNDQPHWTIEAENARLFEADHRAVLRIVRGAVRRDSGGWMRFESDEAVLDTVTYDLEVTGGSTGTTITLPNGFVLQGERFRWEAIHRELRSDDPVVLRGARTTIRGVGLSFKPEVEELRILDRVQLDVET